jgi:hypothetical protein
MFCPNCGANNSTEQKFCRSCGLNLEKTAESLLDQLPSAQNANLLKYEKTIEKFGNFALGGFGVVMLFGITILIYTVIEKFLVNGANIYFAVLLTGFLVFAFLSLVFVIFNEKLKEKKAKINPAINSEFEKKADTAKLLKEKPFEPVGSITENSTDLLFTENKTLKF